MKDHRPVLLRPTVSFAVLVSLLVSFTLTPMLSSRLLRHPGHPAQLPGPRAGAHAGVRRGYRWLLGKAVRTLARPARGGAAYSLLRHGRRGQGFIPPGPGVLVDVDCGRHLAGDQHRYVETSL
jgi:multidrug efflux pump subunit AcrB